MNNVYASSQGRAEVLYGWMVRFGVLCVAVACLMIPVTASAGSTMTQGEFLGWLASATGDAADLGPNAGPTELVAWAVGKGLTPNGGWNPSAVLTREALAQTLVQLFSLNPKKYNGDFEKNLLREGIVLPSKKDLAREDLVNVMDQFGMQGKLAAISVDPSSPGGRVSGGVVPGGFTNPNNKWYNVPPNMLPGAQGLANAATRGIHAR